MNLYSKNNWGYKNPYPKISLDALHKIENGIYTNSQNINTNEESILSILNFLGAGSQVKTKYFNVTPFDIPVNVATPNLNKYPTKKLDSNGNMYIELEYGTPTLEEDDIIGLAFTIPIPEDHAIGTDITLYFHFRTSAEVVTTETLALTCKVGIVTIGETTYNMDTLVANLFDTLTTLEDFNIDNAGGVLSTVILNEDIIPGVTNLTFSIEQNLLGGTHEGNIQLYGVTMMYEFVNSI